MLFELRIKNIHNRTKILVYYDKTVHYYFLHQVFWNLSSWNVKIWTEKSYFLPSFAYFGNGQVGNWENTRPSGENLRGFSIDRLISTHKPPLTRHVCSLTNITALKTGGFSSQMGHFLSFLPRNIDSNMHAYISSVFRYYNLWQQSSGPPLHPAAWRSAPEAVPSAETEAGPVPGPNSHLHGDRCGTGSHLQVAKKLIFKMGCFERGPWGGASR